MLTELVDYEYYKNLYGDSSIPESSFKKYAIEASSKINLYTFNRISEDILDDNIKNTVCEVINVLYEQEQLIAKLNEPTSDKVSETVGPHSISYVNKSNFQAQRILNKSELNKLCYQIIAEHLLMTGLMYCGGTY